ncbi:hypothetical protein LTR17_003727 [Elasticomyces elasticus]|nr:hypothetical protein LTR17_003727 [Elasticomyces elasticus]
MADILDQMKRTTKAVIDGYNNWDIEAIMTPRALAASAVQYFASIMPLFKDFTVTADSEIFDPQCKKAALHMNSTATSPLGHYANEYALFLTFTEDGTKITEFDEMVDSAVSGKFFAELATFVKEQGGAESAWANAKK